MIVVTLSKCPPGLKGDITKWLLEVNTGVYVGKVNTRVRELLWKRICEHCGSGKATMVFSARNEQGFAFYVHNTDWKPIDYDGMILIKKPLPPKVEKLKQKSISKRERKTKEKPQTLPVAQKSKQERPIDITVSVVNKEIMPPMDFVAIDLETTGLKSDRDSIIELAAIRYKQGRPTEQYHALVKCENGIPETISKLTGITKELLEKYGLSIEKAINGIINFIADDILIGHYISFDMLFLRNTCSRLGVSFKKYQVIDTVAFAKELYKEPIENYRLVTLVKQLGISEQQEHRALPDAALAARLYMKLNKKM